MSEPVFCFDWLQNPAERATLEAAVGALTHLLDADESALLIPADEGRQLEFVMCATRTGSNATLVGQRMPMDAGLVGDALRSGETLVDAPVFKGLIQADFTRADYGNPTSVIAVPLVHHEISFGVLTLVSFDPMRKFSADDVAAFKAFAGLVELVLYKQSVIGNGR